MRKRSEVRRAAPPAAPVGVDEILDEVSAATSSIPPPPPEEEPRGAATSRALAEELKASAANDASDLFESNNEVPQTEREKQFERIVATVFDDDLDVEAEFTYLRNALVIREEPHLQQRGVFRNYSNFAEDNRLRANRLRLLLEKELAAAQARIEPVIEAMRDEANDELQEEKDQKKRSKAITEADIKGRAAKLFADEWYDVQRRLAKYEGTVDHAKALEDAWVSRCYSARTMLETAR